MHDALSAEAFAEAWAEGQALSLDQGADLAVRALSNIGSEKGTGTDYR